MTQQTLNDLARAKVAFQQKAVLDYLTSATNDQKQAIGTLAAVKSKLDDFMALSPEKLSFLVVLQTFINGQLKTLMPKFREAKLNNLLFAEFLEQPHIAEEWEAFKQDNGREGAGA